MSKIIPKEDSDIFQRWQLVSLDGEHLPEAAEPEEIATDPPPSEVVLPTVEEVEAIRRQAHDEGRAEGRAEGRQEGYDAGYAEGQAHAAQEVAQLAALKASYESALHGLEQGMADELLQLALDMARQMLREGLRIKPEAVLPMVREAIGELVQTTRHPVLVLHPDDAALVRRHLASELSALPWKIKEDPQISRGGCRVESESVEIDATLENRWKRLTEALGRHDNWND